MEKDAGALLGKAGSTDPAGVLYLGIICKPLTWVRSVESCTAKVTKRALERVTRDELCFSTNPEGPRRLVDELVAVVRHPLGRRLPRQDGVVVAENITGMLNVALACGMTGSMSAWTEAPPSREVIEFFMARGLDYAARRELVRLCLLGDWPL